ncbi:ABC transporter permease subunit [Halalkalibacter oceani]|uniref:ABC transporter permease subunit n=1 Tax=Halalkalibacter oceani TaxID=1653776 RepID=A0A9X2DRX6_9BACI|nr:ABC transporter permease subunit [Halalkalibacter oceani]MCM3715844.1 ABC transporter permease subunit [Halalkalibacter oceani]
MTILKPLIAKNGWFRNQILPWCLPVGFLVSWQLLTQLGIISTRILPAPLSVLEAAVDLTKSGLLPDYIQSSASRAFYGFAIGGGIGFLLGLLNGIWKLAEQVLDTSMQMIRNIPNLALIPLVIVWFGIGEESKVILIASSVFFPIYLNTYHGIKNVDPLLKEMGIVYRLKGFSLFWKVILPAALPSIIVGLRFSLGVMWLTLIVAETIASNSGIGYMATNAREFMQMDIVVLSVIIYALFGKLSDVIARAMERRLLQWHPNYSVQEGN